MALAGVRLCIMGYSMQVRCTVEIFPESSASYRYFLCSGDCYTKSVVCGFKNGHKVLKLDGVCQREHLRGRTASRQILGKIQEHFCSILSA